MMSECAATSGQGHASWSAAASGGVGNGPSDEGKRLCPYCGRPATLERGRTIYPHRPDLAALPFWACLPCEAWTGCHPGTEKRMGRLANASTRKLKQAAHAAFDPLWKSGRMSRTQAYRWLQERTGLSPRDCHIGWMSDDDLRRVPQLCSEAQA